jgi:energy-converting hydrogenase Eha subunit C
VIEVPTAGVHYAFEKLYANQAEDEATFSIPYASSFGATLGQALALLGTALFWSGIALALRGAPLDRRVALGLAALGFAVLWIPLGYLQINPVPPLLLSLLALAGLAFATRERWQALGGTQGES